VALVATAHAYYTANVCCLRGLALVCCRPSLECHWSTCTCVYQVFVVNLLNETLVFSGCAASVNNTLPVQPGNIPPNGVRRPAASGTRRQPGLPHRCCRWRLGDPFLCQHHRDHGGCRWLLVRRRLGTAACLAIACSRDALPCSWWKAQGVGICDPNRPPAPVTSCPYIGWQRQVVVGQETIDWETETPGHVGIGMWRRRVAVAAPAPELDSLPSRR
jgi:hypothetical protein